MDRQSVSVCVTENAAAKNASLPHDGRRTQAKADVIHLCALGSRRVEESSKE